MGAFFKMIELVILTLFSENIGKSIIYKLKKTKKILVQYKELRICIYILLLPIFLICEFLVVCIKIILVWILSSKRYGDIKYMAHQAYQDKTKLHLSVKKIYVRCKLLNELFTKGAEKKVSYGEKNPDIIFYVIRPYYFLTPNALILNNVANLLTQYYYCLQKLSYAIEKGYVPIIDWENYGKMPHSEDFPIYNTMNSWEYYWNQPCQYNLDEVYKSKNVILSTQNIGQFGYIPNCAMVPPLNKYANEISKRCPKYAQYIPLNCETRKYVEKYYERLFPKNKLVLGVVVRGSSYGFHKTQFSSHPTQISIEELIEEVKKYLSEWNYEYFFFMNEVKELVDKMKEEFGDKVIILPRLRDSLYRNTDEKKNPMYKSGNKFQTNLDYITEVALLSKCDSLLGSMSSGTRTAIIWNNQKYTHIHIFDKGLW